MDIKDLPEEPGCYLFKDSGGRVIYVGKAKDLKKRVFSYFNKKDLDPKTQALIYNVAEVDYVITNNEKEALILENNLIKKHQPKYNIDLKDSKRYAYILLTEGKWPRLKLARRKDEKGEYFGPFVSAEKRDSLLRFASNVFMLRTCKRLPKRECLRSHMGRCMAPCIHRVDEKEYAASVEDARKLLSGKNKALVSELRRRMTEASDKRDFEQAKTLRDQLHAIESLLEKQSVETSREHDQDIINYASDGKKVHLAVFNARKGILSSKDEFEFSSGPDFLEEFLLQYYSEGKIPSEIIVPGEVSGSMVDYFSELKGSRVKVFVPKRGEKKELLELVKKNVESLFKEDELAMQDLQEKLGLSAKPRVIECFDVSHTSGTDPVGSMVRFVEGQPDKSGYRRFKIKAAGGMDDYAMLAEIVLRRYQRLKGEDKAFPDLIVIDGGRGQLSAAFKVLRKLGLRIPVIALAKKHEEVYFPGFPEPERFDRRSKAVKLLQKVRDEAHRFAIAYHKLLRKKRIMR